MERRKRNLRPGPQVPPRVYRLERLLDVVGLGRSTIDEMIANGKFPKPIMLSPKVRAWLVSDIDAWLNSRIDERDARQAASR